MAAGKKTGENHIMCHHRTFAFFASIAVFAALPSAEPLEAQQPRVDSRAVAGKPFGVGRITLDLTPEMLPTPLGADGIRLVEKNGRILYPAIDNPAFAKVMQEVLENISAPTADQPVRQAVRGLLQEIADQPPRITVYFLFRGNEPLHVSLLLRDRMDLQIVPRADVAAADVPRGRLNARLNAARNPGYAVLLQQWWQHYAKSPSGVFSPKRDDPPMLDTYLTAMLARRLNLQLPRATQTDSTQDMLRKEIGLNTDGESLHAAMMQDRVLGLGNWNEPAIDSWAVTTRVLKIRPEPAVDAKIEPMAMRVPPECFYARFGSFANFLWLQDTLAKWGGDAQNLIALRGLDHDMSGRMERQLVLKQTVLSRMLGDTVIADVAIIGTDMFFREGASYGILFQARNNFALSTSLTQQRQERINAGGATEEKLTIDGQAVSYLSSPDGRVRSYYVADGDFHFVTTSKTLVKLFLATKSGKNSLGNLPDFRRARSVMPVSRDDTVLLYASSDFFEIFMCVEHRLEMIRRMQAAIDIEIVQMARLAAAAERRPGETIEQLKTAGFLPPEFGPLPDGSRVVLSGGEVVDSLRGRRGAFVPVADVEMLKATQAELAEYKQFDEYRRANWGRIDPVVAAIKRTALKDNREQVVVDVTMTPLVPKHVELLRQWIGEADSQQLKPVAGNAADVEAVLKNQRIFAGLCDKTPPSYAGAVRWLLPSKYRDLLVGYIGTTGELGLLNVLNIGIPPQSDAEGFAMSPLGGWRRQYGEFTVFSYQREVLESVAPQLQFEKAARPAQVRVRAGDLSTARIAPTLNDLGFARTRETSLGNLRFFHALNQQLGVPPAACRDTAEELLDAKIICPLGGKYVLLQSPDGGPSYWTSTALPLNVAVGDTKIHAPHDYQAPVLRWFRGLTLDAAAAETTVSIHAEVLMQMPAKK